MHSAQRRVGMREFMNRTDAHIAVVYAVAAIEDLLKPHGGLHTLRIRWAQEWCGLIFRGTTKDEGEHGG